MCEKRACRAGSQDEDAHGVGKLYHRRGRVDSERAICGFERILGYKREANCAEFVDKRTLRHAPTGAAYREKTQGHLGEAPNKGLRVWAETPVPPVFGKERIAEDL